MPKLSKRIVDAAEAKSKDYVIWDDDLAGFGLRVFTTGKRSYVLQYRALGRSRRYTIGPHGVWTPETARKEALIQLARVAKGENPAEERELDHKAITMKQLCERYLEDLGNGLILGKGNRPKRPSTKITDTGRINRHIIPLVGTRRVKDLTQPEIIKIMMDIMAGRTKVNVKTENLRGRSIVTGGVGTAARTIGLLSGILTYAVNLGIIEKNPAHGIKRPKDHTRWFNSEPLTLEDLRGRVIVLGTFQMLCPGCVANGLPQLQRIEQTFNRRDVAVIGLHTVFEHHAAMTPTSLEAFLLEYRIGFPVGVDSHEDSSGTPITMTRYGLRGTPSLVLIDRAGLIRFRGFGHEPDLAVGARIAQLIAQQDVGMATAGESGAAVCVPGGECG